VPADLWELLGKACAPVPRRAEWGTEETVVHLEGGGEHVLPRPLPQVMRSLHRVRRIDEAASRRAVARVTGRRRDQPLALLPLVLACVPLADHSPQANGYVVLERLREVRRAKRPPYRTVLVFHDGTELYSLADLKTVRRRIHEAREVAQREQELWDAADGALQAATPRPAPVPWPLSLCPVAAAVTALLANGILSAAEVPEHYREESS